MCPAQTWKLNGRTGIGPDVLSRSRTSAGCALRSEDRT